MLKERKEPHSQKPDLVKCRRNAGMDLILRDCEKQSKEKKEKRPHIK